MRQEARLGQEVPVQKVFLQAADCGLIIGVVHFHLRNHARLWDWIGRKNCNSDRCSHPLRMQDLRSSAVLFTCRH